MTDTPRSWFRFHLLTAVLMMFAAGGLIGLNLRRVEKVDYKEIPATVPPLPPAGTNFCNNFHPAYTEVVESSIQGWPLNFYRAASAHDAYFESAQPQMTAVLPPVVTWNQTYMILNSISGITILAAVTVASEFLIRRREARKP